MFSQVNVCFKFRIMVSCTSGYAKGPTDRMNCAACPCTVILFLAAYLACLVYLFSHIGLRCVRPVAFVYLPETTRVAQSE
jgi:hypothetical protein